MNTYDTYDNHMLWHVHLLMMTEASIVDTFLILPDVARQ